MNRLTMNRILIAIPAAALLLAGCLEREEQVTVKRDGSVQYQLEIKGDPGDFAGAAALPSKAGGWDVSDETITKEDGKQEQVRQAALRVGPREPQPATYALDAEGESIALMFPTELTVEKRRDGTYYHFSRMYEPRQHAKYEYYNARIKELLGDDFPEGKDLSELSPEHRAKLVTALRWVEMNKKLEFAQAGLEALEDRWPQDWKLHVIETIKAAYSNFDVAHVVDMLGQPQSPERDRAIDDFGHEVDDAAREAVYRKLRELQAPRGEIDMYFAAADTEALAYDVTQDLADERFLVKVKMPGTIVAHDGERVADGVVIWEFDGKSLMDRTQTVRVTSRLGPRERD